ncbi:MAG: hypothetical protein ACT6FG_04120 [Methanosarcinaceae archaeon]
MSGYTRFYYGEQYHSLLVLAKSGGVTYIMDIDNGVAPSLHDVADSGEVGSKVYDDAPPVDDDVRVFAGSADEAAELAFNIGGDYGLLFTERLEMLEVTRVFAGNVNRKGYEHLANKKQLRS